MQRAAAHEGENKRQDVAHRQTLGTRGQGAEQDVSTLLMLRPLLEARAWAQATANGGHLQGKPEHFHHIQVAIVAVTDAVQTREEALKSERPEQARPDRLAYVPQATQDREQPDEKLLANVLVHSPPPLP
jgi:hypothetical protein